MHLNMSNDNNIYLKRQCHEQYNRNVSEEKTHVVLFAARHCDPVKFIDWLSVCVIADARRCYEGVILSTSVPNHHLT